MNKIPICVNSLYTVVLILYRAKLFPKFKTETTQTGEQKVCDSITGIIREEN